MISETHSITEVLIIAIILLLWGAY